MIREYLYLHHIFIYICKFSYFIYSNICTLINILICGKYYTLIAIIMIKYYMPARLNYNNNGKCNPRTCLKMIYHSFSCGILVLPFDGEIQSFGDVSPYSVQEKNGFWGVEWRKHRGVFKFSLNIKYALLFQCIYNVLLEISITACKHVI